MLHNETLDVIPLNVYKKKCDSCTIYMVLFAIFFIASICISSVFIYFIGILKSILVFKKINIKNRTYYFLNDMINIKDFDPSLIKIDKKSYENIGIYYIGYITIESISNSEYINSVNPLYLIIGDPDGYTEENNRNKYLTFASTNKNKKALEKYTKLWN